MPRSIITANHLQTWAHSRGAQAYLPILLRRLVEATGQGPIRISFPAHESIQLGGWDGTALTSGPDIHVPEGASGWELSTRADVKSKADEDYDKRTADPLGVDPTQSTFVFATPRRWGGAQDWVSERKANGPWLDVRAYDADDLEYWLERAPAVDLWLAEHLGLQVDDATTLGSYWRDWSSSTAPPLSAHLVLAGRDSCATELSEWWQSGAKAATVAAPSREEALAVIAATVDQLDTETREKVEAQTLVVSSEAAWKRLAGSKQPLVLIPRVEGLEPGAALSQGHRVLVPANANVVVSNPRAHSGSTIIQAGRVNVAGAEAALVAMGVPKSRAADLGKVARRNLLALRRSFPAAPGTLTPAWLGKISPAKLAPLLLLGGWHRGAEGDRAAAAALSGASYEELEETLRQLEAQGDPPARLIGSGWRAVSLEDLWTHLSPSVAQVIPQGFVDIAVAILTQPETSGGDLAGQIAASLGDERPYYSRFIRETLASGLGFLGTLGSEAPVAPHASSFAVSVQAIVRKAMEEIQDQPPVAIALAPLLPDLAEAAPDQLLSAIDKDLRRDRPTLLHLFQDTTDDFFASSHHTGLLWALERVAWSPRFLGASALQLARLARLDPGGKLMNRPAASLTDLFRPQDPGTMATVEEREAVLDQLRRAEPEAAWNLLISLLPQGHGSWMVKAPPRWRDWAAEAPRKRTWADFFRVIDGVVDRIILDAGPIGPRWTKVVEGLGQLRPENIEQILNNLEVLMTTGRVTDGDQEELREALRWLLSSHRSMDDADRRLPDRTLSRLEALLTHLAPGSLGLRHAWLFDWFPKLPEGRDSNWAENQAAVAAAQELAVGELVEKGGLPLLLECAREAEQPGILGRLVGRRGELENDATWLGDLAATVDAKVLYFVAGYVNSRFGSGDVAWLNGLLSHAKIKWSSEAQTRLLESLPPSGVIWDRVRDLGTTIEAAYWTRTRPYGLSEPADALRCAQNLLIHGRPFGAIEVLALYKPSVVDPTHVELALSALESAITTPADDKPTMPSFDDSVERLLDELDEAGVEASRLAQLEWYWMPLFRYGRRNPRALHTELRNNPGFFAELVSIAYPGRDEDPLPPDEERKQRWEIAYDVLAHWRTVPGFGGTREPGELRKWVLKARTILAEQDRADAGDICIGHLLSGSPNGEDGAWPHEEVRDLLEELGSDVVEQEVAIGLYNARGMVARHVTRDGVEELALAGRYDGYATAVAAWPRTASLLRRIAASYREDARREILRGEAEQEG